MSELALPRVLVVDDSATMRAIVTDVIRDSGGFDVAGTAATGYEAIRRVHELDPDIVTLDLEMPDLDGLDALAYIMNEAPRPVVMLSAHTAAGAAPTLRALELGALDYVLKPAPGEPRGLDRMTERLTLAQRTAAIARVRRPR
ncbi:MAG: response regulator, partial [Longimicrobiales bacterium]